MVNRKVSEETAITMYELDAEGPADVAWVDIRGYNKFLAAVMRSVGTGGLDAFKILGNTATDGSGTDIELADYADVGTLSAVDAVGDTAILEIDQSVLDDNPTVLGVSVSLGHVTATDESVITYVRADAKNAATGLTADVIA